MFKNIWIFLTDVMSGLGSIGWACIGTDQQIKQSFVSFKKLLFKISKVENDAVLRTSKQITY